MNENFKVTKHKILYNILGTIETIIFGLIMYSCFVIMCSVTTDGGHTIKLILIKIVAMCVMVGLAKIEGVLND